MTEKYSTIYNPDSEFEKNKLMPYQQAFGQIPKKNANFKIMNKPRDFTNILG